MRMVTCIDLSYTTNKRKSLENSCIFTFFYLLHLNSFYKQDGLVVPGRYTAFFNEKKMVKILHRELERKGDKVKHIKLEVMRPKTKNNMN